MKVIVTRPSPEAETFACEVGRIGAEAVLSPVMAIRARSVAVDLNSIEALAFTSSNGVRAFVGLSADRRLPVFAVGAATADAALTAGFSMVSAARGEVGSLATLIFEAKPSGVILHLAGSARAGDLVQLLSAKGIRARRQVIYDAVEIEEIGSQAAAILADGMQEPAIVFFSPRSARIFVRQAERAGLLGSLRRSIALCFSEEIAEALSDVDWSAVRFASERTSAAMLSLVEEELAGRKGRTIAPR